MPIPDFQAASSTALGCKKIGTSLIPGTFSVKTTLPKADLACLITVFFIPLTSEIYSRRDQSPGMLGRKCTWEFQN